VLKLVKETRNNVFHMGIDWTRVMPLPRELIEELKCSVNTVNLLCASYDLSERLYFLFSV
jgi:beta-glucosidase/6-phospho-beta-glucosidase/beta-galactosidase